MNAQASLKPSGPWEVRRRIKLQSLAHAADAVSVERALAELPGVVKAVADVDRQRVDVRYNASQQNFQNIVETMETTGFPPLDSWWSRIKGNWYRFSDETARENARAPPPACCNKPPK